MGLDRIYDSNFYAATTEGSLAAARRILETLWAKRPFNSVVDVGCGTGAWLLAARELGAKSLRGMEGRHIPAEQLLVPHEVIVRADLAQPIVCTERFDLCLCLEVAEHLPKTRGEGLVDDLAKLSSLVVFSAATPFQGGNGHLNEMWPEYWARLFRQHGYLPWTGLRETLWTDRSIPWWYRQNLLVFVHEGSWDSLLSGAMPASPHLLTVVHPENYLWSVRRERGQLATSFEFDLDLYYSCLSGEGAPFGYGPEFSVQVSEPIEQSLPSVSPQSPGPAPVISVIIPCYRQAQYLPQAVRSVLDQTFQQVEAIIVDDGSPDDPRSQLGELADDPRVRYIRQENSGVGPARNTGIQASRGMFLTFLDADDWLDPEFCHCLHQALSSNNALGFVYCDLHHSIQSETQKIDKEYSVGASRRIVSGNILPSLLVGGYFPPHTVLVRKAVLSQVGIFDPELGGHADWDLWLRIAAAGYPVQYVDEKLSYYRIHADSMSRNEKHMSDTRSRTLRKLFKTFPQQAADAIHELCRSVEQQFAANKFLHERLLAIRPDNLAAEYGQLLFQLQGTEIARDALREQAEKWRFDAERLQGIDEKFSQYFQETQAWIASREEARFWHEQQAEYWKGEAERLANELRQLDRTRTS